MGINSFSSKTAPDMVLQQAIFGKVPDIPPYAALAELNNRTKSKQMQQAQMGQQAMAQNAQQQQQPPIAQQVAQQAQAMDQGVGALPTQGQHFAAGGIVSFSGGGLYDLDRDPLVNGTLLKRMRDNIPEPLNEGEQELLDRMNERTMYGEVPGASTNPINDTGYKRVPKGAFSSRTIPADAQYPTTDYPTDIGVRRSASIGVRGAGGLGGLGIKKPVNGAKPISYKMYDAQDENTLASDKAKGSAMYADENAAYDAAVSPAQKFYDDMYGKAKADSEKKKDWMDRLADLAVNMEDKGRGRRGSSIAGAMRGVIKTDKEEKALQQAQMEKATQQRTLLAQAQLAFKMGNTKDGMAKMAELRSANERNIGLENAQAKDNNALAMEQYKADAGIYGHDVSAAASLQSAQIHAAAARDNARDAKEQGNYIRLMGELDRIQQNAEKFTKERFPLAYLPGNSQTMTQAKAAAEDYKNKYIRDAYRSIPPDLRGLSPAVEATIRGTPGGGSPGATLTPQQQALLDKYR